MNICIVHKAIIPAHLYGGTERVIWDLGKALTNSGHQVTFLVNKGSSCDFANLVEINPEIEIVKQIPENTDIVHFNYNPKEVIDKPYIITQHGNLGDPSYLLDTNTVFVSRDHAHRHNSDEYVYNGLDWDNYPQPELKHERKYFHFLAKAAWRVKNVKGAIGVARKAKNKLIVMGGTRLNLKMGFRFTPYPSVSFAGMVNNIKKGQVMNQSKGLLFPVRWHEPFGLALTESLYFGCPVLGTPYGSLPEIIKEDVGFLSVDTNELANTAKHIEQFNKQNCHEYARDVFNAKQMAGSYLKKYERVLNGSTLNQEQPHLLKRQEDKFLPFK